MTYSYLLFHEYMEHAHAYAHIARDDKPWIKSYTIAISRQSRTSTQFIGCCPKNGMAKAGPCLSGPALGLVLYAIIVWLTEHVL